MPNFSMSNKINVKVQLYNRDKFEGKTIKMSHVHKEKERLRHQKQVKLLNKVMEYVPKVPNEPQSKVRSLRRLVLYAHYLQIIHKKLTQGLCTDATAVENCVKGPTKKLSSKPMKVSRQPKKKPKAHIVFLRADKSGNCTNNVLKSCMTHHNIQEIQSGDQESTSELPSNYEYKVPDVMSDGSRTNMLINQEDTFVYEDIDHLQHIKDFSISSNNCEVSSKSIIHNNEKTYEDLDFNLSKNLYCKEEHFLPVVVNCEAFNSNVKESEEYTLYDADKFAHSIVINDENLRASKHKLDNFHTHVTNGYDNNDLENFEFSDTRNKNFKTADLSISDKGKEYLLNSYESNNIQNFNPGYESPSFTTKYLQNSSSDYSGWYNSDFSLKSESDQPIYCNESFVIENTSNYSISSTSTTRINIDIENLSDSSTSCNNLSDSSNSAQYNSYNSCINASYNPLNNLTKLEPLEMESDVFPLFLPNFSYMGSSSVLMNEPLIGQMYDTTLPQFSSVYPSRFNFSRSCNSLAAFQPDSVHLFKNEVRQSENYKDTEFLYSPSLYNSIHSEQLSIPSSKSKVNNFSNASEASVTENSKSALFEEEISYPLTDYLNNL